MTEEAQDHTQWNADTAEFAEIDDSARATQRPDGADVAQTPGTAHAD